jgi:hypothetical protein
VVLAASPSCTACDPHGHTSEGGAPVDQTRREVVYERKDKITSSPRGFVMLTEDENGYQRRVGAGGARRRIGLGGDLRAARRGSGLGAGHSGASRPKRWRSVGSRIPTRGG